MQLFVERVEITMRSWITYFTPNGLRILINSEEYVVNMHGEDFNYFSNISDDFVIEIYYKNELLGRYVDFEKNTNIIKFSNKFICGVLHIALVDDGWNYMLFDGEYGNIVYDEEDNSKCIWTNSYKNRNYYVNTGTLESSFTNSFQSQNDRFSRFEKIIHGDSIYYVDFFSKIVLDVHPWMKFESAKENRRRIKKKMGYLVNSRRGGVNWINIKRNDLLGSGIKEIMKNIDIIKNSQNVFSFEEEIGEDYGGIRREFIYLTIREMFKDPRLIVHNGIYDVEENNTCPEFIYDFSCQTEIIKEIYENNSNKIYKESDNSKNINTCENTGRVEKNIDIHELNNNNDQCNETTINGFNNTFRSNVKVKICDELFYTYLGIIFGLAFRYEETIGEMVSLAFYENLCGRNYGIKHIQDVEYQRNILKAASQGITEFGKLEDIVEQKLFLSKKNAYDHIRVGFQSVLRGEFSRFSAIDLFFVLYGFEPVSIHTLKAYANYEKCNRNTKEIVWLWEILSTKNANFLHKFLQFCTGSGNYQVTDKNVKLWIELLDTSERFIRASACAYRLYLPVYRTKQEMEYYLDYSILNTEGFHKV